MPSTNWRPLLIVTVTLTVAARLPVIAGLYNFEKSIEISEESPPQALGNMATLGNLYRHLYTTGPLSYALEMHDPYVTVDSSTGEIRLKAPIDLETLCQPSTRCPLGGRHAFSVVARELPPPTQPNLQGRLVARGNFTLLVRDINDHAPRFQSTYEEIQRDESVCLVIGIFCPNPRVALPIAKDDDFSPELSRVAYTIDPTSASNETLETFLLKVDEFGHPYLLIQKALDAERLQSYQFDLVAQDSHAKKGRITVRIVIKDFNDNSPMFEQAHQSVRVSEDKAKGYVIVKLTAKDKDLNHKLEYSIDASSPEESRRHFEVLSDGSLTIKEPLDYETQANFRMQVKVWDGRFEDKTVVEVIVEDANDNAPEYEEGGQLQVQEGREAGERIGTVRVFDRDSGPRGEVDCETRSQHNNRFLSVKFAQTDQPNMYAVHSAMTFDRERDPVVTGTLVCWDRGLPSLTSTYTARVSILDRNDNAPQFQDADASGLIEAQLVENNRPGLVVIRLRATDADEGENARLTYSLVGNEDEEFFDIDAVTGEVSARRSLDRERRDSYRLRLQVTDGGQPPLSGTAMLKVGIADENDNAPQFTGATAFQVTENTAPPVVLGVMTATDADIGVNGQVFFTQLSHNHMDRFRVDLNGSLVAIAKLDREELSEYSIPVRVSDRAAAPTSKYTDQLVLVRVLDVNDETPRIVQPASGGVGGNFSAGGGAAVRISIYTHHPGSLVLRVRAIDGDEGVNGEIVYSLTQDHGSKFSINPSTGEINVARALDVSDMTRHKLMVQASDRDPKHPRSDAKVIYVDVDDSAPPPSNLLDEAELAAAHTRRNVIIIVILAAVSAVLAIILIIAITCVNRPCCGMYGPGQYGPGLGGRGSKRPPETEADQQYMEQALHLTVADGDIIGGGWGAGGPTDLHRQTGGAQSPIVTTSFASPIHEGYCGRTLPNPRHLQHQQQLSHTVVKPPAVAASKSGKSDQIKEDAASTPQHQHLQLQQSYGGGSNFCTIARGPHHPSSYIVHHQQQQQQQQQQQPGDAVDGAQSDSGRGCSDEDLSSGPVYYQASSNSVCQMHRVPSASHRAEAPSPARFAPLPVLHSTLAAASASTPARCAHHHPAAAAPTPPPPPPPSSQPPMPISLPSSFDDEPSWRHQQGPPPPLQTVEEVAGSQETVSAASASGAQADQVCRQIDSLFFRDMSV